jgi:DnaJ-class molecular chaperone
MADPYATLGVARGADDKAIKSAYRKLAKELHPDRNKDNPKAAERFSEVTRAYDLLSDKDKRARFDRGEIDADGNPANPFAGMGGGFGGAGFGGGRSGGFRPEDLQGMGGGAEGVDNGDLFEGLFGGGGGRSSPFGGGGFGRAGPGGFGGGQQRRHAPQPKGGDIAYRLRVPFVDAARLADQRITLADGKTIDLKLPAGVEDGTQMRLKGRGQQGPGGAGDGIVTIAIDPHPFFRREGDNVRLDLPITLTEAVAGGKVKVPTVDGPVMLTIKPGTSSGTTMRLGGKGFTGKTGKRGDQLVTLEIDLPDDVTELGRRLEGWQDTRNPRAKLGV